MIDKIQLTLYEIFGYLLPGAIGAVAVAIFYWGVWMPYATFPVDSVHPDAVGWAALTGISYLLGHLVQAVGTRYLKGAEKSALENGEYVPLAIVTSAKKRASAIAEVQAEEIDSFFLFRFADEYALQKGVVGDREIFVYREGFYKGCTVALALFCIALVIRSFRAATVAFSSTTHHLSHTQILAAALFAAIASQLCKQRFYRFGIYRVTRALFAFLALSQGCQTSPEVSKEARNDV